MILGLLLAAAHLQQQQQTCYEYWPKPAAARMMINCCLCQRQRRMHLWLSYAMLPHLAAVPVYAVFRLCELSAAFPDEARLLPGVDRF